MLTEVKAHLRLLIRYFSFNLQSSIEYKTNFIVQTFGMILNNLTFILFWWILFNRMGNSIGGYQFKQLLLIWALVASGFGFSQIIFGNSLHLTRLITDGQLDAYLLQPKNVLWNILISRSNTAAWGDLIYGIILYFFAAPVSLVNLILFLLLVISAGLLFTAVMVLAHTLTFYLGKASAFSNLIPDFAVTLSIYPEGIFKGRTRFLLYTLLPAGFISYIPERLLHRFNWQQALYLLLFDLVFITLTIIFFKRGLKKYESGNLVQTRL